MELVQTAKHDKLADEGYLYRVEKRSPRDSSVFYWKCEMYQKTKCTARVHSKNGQILKRMGTHTHEPNRSRVEALKVMQEIKDRALASNERTRESVSKAFANLSQEMLALLPSLSALCRAVQREKRARQKAADQQGLFPSPVSFSSDWPLCEDGNQQDKESTVDVKPQFSHLQTHEAPKERESPDHDFLEEWQDDEMEKAEEEEKPPIVQTHEAPEERESPDHDFLGEWQDDEMENAEEEEKPPIVQGPVLEFHTAKLNMKGMRAYKEICQQEDYITARAAFSDTVVGHWVTAGHRVNQVSQLIQYDSLSHLMQVQRDMEDSSDWLERCRFLESSVLSSDSVLMVLAPQSELYCQFESSEKAVYELQILSEKRCPIVLGADGILVGHFVTLYGPSHLEYRLLRYASADSAFAAASNSINGSERRLLLPLTTSMLH